VVERAHLAGACLIKRRKLLSVLVSRLGFEAAIQTQNRVWRLSELPLGLAFRRLDFLGRSR
jgi:hypothetical protein